MKSTTITSQGRVGDRHLVLMCCDYPPPLTTAGIIPSRLVRYLPEFGWQVSVISKAARPAKAAGRAAPSGGPAAGRVDATPRFAEWLPFGDSVFAVPSMLRAGMARHAELPADAVMSSAAPVAACLAADALARRVGVPVHHLHGDPWGPCDLRRPIRPFWTRALEGWGERRLNRRAASLILNTECTRSDYLTAFPFLDPARVHVLRSPHDRAAITGAPGPVFDRPTLLLPGRFSRVVPPGQIFDLARALAATMGASAPVIALTDPPGPIPVDLERQIAVIGRYPAEAMFALMGAADILIAPASRSKQRIPLKVSDYLCATAPVLAIEHGPHPELRALVAGSGMGRVFAAERLDEAAAWVAQVLAGGRHPVAPRNGDLVEELSARSAARRLAAVLDSGGRA